MTFLTRHCRRPRNFIRICFAKSAKRTTIIDATFLGMEEIGFEGISCFVLQTKYSDKLLHVPLTNILCFQNYAHKRRRHNMIRDGVEIT